MIVSPKCSHKTTEEHKCSDYNFWVCTTCGENFVWDNGPEGSSYFGCSECLDCGRPNIAAIFCSQACEKKYKRDRPTPGDPREFEYD